MQSTIIKNILSDMQINQLKVLRDGLNVSNLGKKGYGREIRPVPDLKMIPDEIKNIFTTVANVCYQKPLKLYAVAYGRYSNNFGIPKLPPHIDEVPSQFTLDYQLNGNMSWPINIEGENYYLENNDALVFEGESVLHWRPKKTFSDDEFLDLMWFQFIEESHWGHKYDVRPDYSNFKINLNNKLKKWKAVYDES